MLFEKKTRADSCNVEYAIMVYRLDGKYYLSGHAVGPSNSSSVKYLGQRTGSSVDEARLIKNVNDYISSNKGKSKAKEKSTLKDGIIYSCHSHGNQIKYSKIPKKYLPLVEEVFREVHPEMKSKKFNQAFLDEMQAGFSKGDPKNNIKGDVEANIMMSGKFSKTFEGSWMLTPLNVCKFMKKRSRTETKKLISVVVVKY